MSITALELGTFPPRGTTVILQLLPLRVPQEGSEPTILWNLTGRYPHGEGSAVCFSATGDDAISLAHIAGGLCAHFKLQQAQSVPPAPADLAKLGLPGVPAVSQLAFSQGTFRQPVQDPNATLETFMQKVQTFMDIQARAAAVGVAQFATTIEDAEAKKLFLEKLPDSMKVGPHPKTGDYAPACGAKLTVNGPKLEGVCLTGGPCKLTSSGRCWRWKGTEDTADTTATALETNAGTIELTAPAIEVDAPAVVALVEEPVVKPPAKKSPAKKTPAKKKVAAKKASPKKAPAVAAPASK
jgi:hypothetical protein